MQLSSFRKEWEEEMKSFGLGAGHSSQTGTHWYVYLTSNNPKRK